MGIDYSPGCEFNTNEAIKQAVQGRSRDQRSSHSRRSNSNWRRAAWSCCRSKASRSCGAGTSSHRRDKRLSAAAARRSWICCADRQGRARRDSRRWNLNSGIERPSRRSSYRPTMTRCSWFANRRTSLLCTVCRASVSLRSMYLSAIGTALPAKRYDKRACWEAFTNSEWFCATERAVDCDRQAGLEPRQRHRGAPPQRRFARRSDDDRSGYGPLRASSVMRPSSRPARARGRVAARSTGCSGNGCRHRDHLHRLFVSWPQRLRDRTPGTAAGTCSRSTSWARAAPGGAAELAARERAVDLGSMRARAVGLRRGLERGHVPR